MSHDITQTQQPSITRPDQTLELYSLWQFGDWTRLAQIDTHNASEEHLALKASAQLQLGETQVAKNTLAGLPISPSEQTARLLISGVFNTLGKARAILGDSHQAEVHFIESIETVHAENPSPHLTKARTLAQLEDVKKTKHQHSLQTKPNIPYIDVIGPSGSGKTTLIKHIVEHHGFTLASSLAKTKNELDGKLILDFLKNYPLFLENIQHTLESSDLTSGWFSKLIQGYMKSEKQSIDLITDEGFVCRLNTVFAYQKKPLERIEINRYLDSIPQPQILIIIKATPELVFERMRSRPSGLPGRMRLLNSQQQQTVIQNQITMLDWVEDYYKTKPTELIVTDAENSLEDMIKKLLDLKNSITES